MNSAPHFYGDFYGDLRSRGESPATPLQEYSCPFANNWVKQCFIQVKSLGMTRGDTPCAPFVNLSHGCSSLPWLRRLHPRPSQSLPLQPVSSTLACPMSAAALSVVPCTTQEVPMSRQDSSGAQVMPQLQTRSSTSSCVKRGACSLTVLWDSATPSSVSAARLVSPGATRPTETTS